MSKSPIPVTVLSWFLWAGKTTLLKHILTQRGDKKIALIVNDMAELNIDASLIKNGVELSQTEEKLVEMSNGCICCTLRDDLIQEVKKLCEQGNYDALIIESTGISEPVPVAQTFSYVDEETGIDLGQRAKLDTMVTVVDAKDFLKQLYSAESLYEMKQIDDAEDTRTISHLLVEQVEFANIIVINKSDLVSEQELSKLVSVIRSLNTDARIITTSRGEIDITDIVDTGLFDYEQASQAPLWVKEMEWGWHHHHTPETEEYGITSFIYTRYQPFDMERLRTILVEWLPWVVRAKGVCRLADDNANAFEFAIAWGEVSIIPFWRWMGAQTKQELEMNGQREEYLEIKDRPNKDRVTQLVIIWVKMDRDHIAELLDTALMSI
jgi:G3E family GTPase